ncbi:Tannase and feruloyl esterase [Pseudogymnoascus verrucosus]|uniref:Carboxylic ester hydrolase n=1 Tax=Pseudogymnoascus verrucosus TaxID=342668 RepID=A0A1B8GW21_9PEZI|nr:Tannase and feruloyl esterase [Pseudogymnoascus verrucosus]OBU00042.1 Tannase and feruloyl esterase [Pseudogymnoascus verrucosus]
MFFQALLLFLLEQLLSAASSSEIAHGLTAAFSSACMSLATSLKLPNVIVNFAHFVPAGTVLQFQQDENLVTCNRPNQTIASDICRVAMYVSTSSRSGITLEAWLPSTWTGRFLSTGNGGQSGCIQYEDLGYTSSLGFAAVVSRLQTGVTVGKALTQIFYKRAHTKSYYLGCSTGSRQGLESAQVFPETFDGILAGAPAIDRNRLVAWNGHFFGIIGTANLSDFISAALWNTIHIEVLRQCDGLDGVVDGIIEDPSLCNPRPEALLCKPRNSINCLTPNQAQIVRNVFSDYIAEDRSLIFPRLQPGAELTSVSDQFSGMPSKYIGDWFKYVVFNIKDATYSIALNPANVESFKGNLSAFRAHGGKALIYHGQQDSTVTSPNTARYYDHVSRTMDLDSSSLDDFFRYFRIGGMSHCSGGPGAWRIGQTALGALGGEGGAGSNVLAALVEWVEKGVAPETVRGVGFVNGTVALGVDFVREHCRYPLRNVCVDPKRYKHPKSWKCV